MILPCAGRRSLARSTRHQENPQTAGWSLCAEVSFKVQVKDAHPLVPTSPRDPHLPACRGEKGKFMCANTSGTFAVAVLAESGSRTSSGPRLVAAAGRLDHAHPPRHDMRVGAPCPYLPPDTGVSALVEEGSQRRNLAVGGI